MHAELFRKAPPTSLKNLPAVFACLVALLLFLLSAPHVVAGVQRVQIEGRVFTEAGPLKGATVYVYKTYPDVLSEKAVMTSGKTDRLGRYRLELPAGDYYVTARGSRDGKPYFAYHGANPVHIEVENAWISFMANEVKKPSSAAGESVVKGVVTYKGKRIPDAYIAFYTLENFRFKGIGYKTEQVNSDGSFEFQLPPDRYVVIARKTAGNEIRPLEDGDLYCYYPSNPLEIRPDRTTSIEVPCYPKAVRSSFTSSPVIKSNDYVTTKKLVDSSQKFGITGRVTDSAGAPVKGIYVLAYKVDPGNTTTLTKTFRGVHETINLGKTDENGNYFVALNDDGKYAVLARSSLGMGTPKADETYGVYKNSLRKGLSFSKGQMVPGIDITVVTPLPQTGPGGK